MMFSYCCDICYVRDNLLAGILTDTKCDQMIEMTIRSII
jgi:hypothetical protein